MRKIIVQTLKRIGKLNVNLYFKKYSVVKLVTTHIFSIYSLFIQSLIFELKIINKIFLIVQSQYFFKHKLQ